MEGQSSGVPEFERLAAAATNQVVVLELYIAGSTPKSQRAVANVRRICSDWLPDRCELHIIDIFQQPELARARQILAVPTLIRHHPAPKRLFIGDLSDQGAILAGLGCGQ